MVIYRVIEKLHLNHLVDNDIVSYVISCVGNIVGAIIFSVIAERRIKRASAWIKKR